MANLFDLLPSVTGAGGYDPKKGPIIKQQDLNRSFQAPSAGQVNQDAFKQVSQALPGASSITDTLKNAQNGLQTYGLGDLNNFFNDTPLSGFLSGTDLFGSADLSGTAQTTQFKVRLVSVIDLARAFTPGDINSVIFEVTPSFSETGSVEYTAIQPIHMPGGIQTYKYTNSRTFNITAHLISRNVNDAQRNIRYLQTLRQWRYPYFGNSGTTSATKQPAAPAMGQFNGNDIAMDRIRSSTSESNNELLGAPPEVLYLYAYSTSNNDKRGLDANSRVNINRVPVVLSSLNITYPEDVDYLPIHITPTAKTEPFPVKMDVQITLLEAHSPTEYERFNLAAYKTGNLTNF